MMVLEDDEEGREKAGRSEVTDDAADGGWLTAGSLSRDHGTPRARSSVLFYTTHSLPPYFFFMWNAMHFIFEYSSEPKCRIARGHECLWPFVNLKKDHSVIQMVSHCSKPVATAMSVFFC